MSRLGRIGAQTFRALKVRNFRLFFVGQVVSVSGTWMQTVALGLLILSGHLHGNGLDVGIATALRYLPTLVLGTFGGVVADRIDKRRLLLVTQVSAGSLALVLALLTELGAIQMWEVFLLAALLGVVTLFTNPARQAFVSEMVGRELLPNAVSLNSVLMNSARVLGPAIGGALIYAAGYAPCFYVNAGSYLAVIVAILLMRTAELHRSERVARATGQIREGLRYAWSTPALRSPLLAMAIVGTLAFNFTTTLPLLAEFTYHGGAGAYSTFTAAMGVGAVVGGLLVAHRSRPSIRVLGLIGVGFGATIGLVALLPTELLAVLALVPLGAAAVAFNATANATVQLHADPSMRGRVMSLYTIAFLGSAPIGAPLMGWISDTTSPRVALAIGATATLVASAPLARAWLRSRARGTLEQRPVEVAACSPEGGAAPLTGAPLTGAPLTGAPLTGAPLTGAPLTGAPLTGTLAPVDRRGAATA